jgi:hypothetical protein
VAFCPLNLPPSVSSTWGNTDVHETVGLAGAILAANWVPELKLSGAMDGKNEPDFVSTKDEPNETTLSPLKATFATPLARGIPSF